MRKLNLKNVYLNEANAENDKMFRQEAKEAFEKVKDFLSSPHVNPKDLQQDEYYVLRPTDLDWDEKYPDLYIVMAPEKLNQRGMLMKKNDKYFILLSILNKLGFEGILNRLKGFESVFVHEFIHYLDSHRRKTSKNQSGKKKNVDWNKEYVNSPEELNAYFQEASHKIEEYFDTIEKHKPEILESILSDFNRFLKTATKMFTKGFLENLEKKNVKKIINRLYGLFEMLKNKYKIED